MQQITHDIWLWNEIRCGNEQALYQLYMDTYDSLFRFGLQVSEDRTATLECINETFIDIWGKKDNLPDVEQVSGYLFIIFKRKIFRKLKNKTKKPSPVLMSKAELSSDNYEHSYESMLIATQTENERKLRLQKAIEKLTPRQKELIRMRYFDNCSIEEIADETSIALRTIYNTLHEAIKSLRKALK